MGQIFFLARVMATRSALCVILPRYVHLRAAGRNKKTLQKANAVYSPKKPSALLG